MCSGATSQRASRDRQVQKEPHGTPRHTACPPRQPSRSSSWQRVHHRVGGIDAASGGAKQPGGRSADAASHRRLDRGGVAQEPRDRGATYEWLESQATRVTVRFPDVVAISERTADADLKTRLTDLVGNDLATFKVHRVDAMNDVLEFRSTEVARDSTDQARPSSRPTLDWASRQAYSLWKDQATGASQLEWQDGLLRPRGARAARPRSGHQRTPHGVGQRAVRDRQQSRNPPACDDRRTGARKLVHQPAQKGQRRGGVQPLVRRRTGAGLVLPGSDRGLSGRRPAEARSAGGRLPPIWHGPTSRASRFTTSIRSSPRRVSWHGGRTAGQKKSSGW